MGVLYLCYLGLGDPLTQTQVVAYLEGLARLGYRPVLLTFEPRPPAAGEASAWRTRLAGKGIAWHWLRYHKRPTVPATAWDVLAGALFGLYLTWRYRVRLLHVRSHVPGLVGLLLKRLTGARLLFDIRGFMAEEYVDAGTWPAGGLLFRVTKAVERLLIRGADGLVVLTRKARELLGRWYPRETAGKPLQVVPCCVDLRRSPAPGARAVPAPGGAPLRLVYVGKLGGWYLVEEMAAFAKAAGEMVPGLHWQVWTQSDPAPLRRALAGRGLGGRVSVGSLPPEDVPRALAAADVALSLIRPCLSKLSSSPTKVGEYLAAGLPVVSTPDIGDVDELLLGPPDGSRAAVGVLLRELSPEAYREAVVRVVELLRDPELPARCRRVAERELDLERVGWVRYGQIYQDLLDGPGAGQRGEGRRATAEGGTWDQSRPGVRAGRRPSPTTSS
jgi:glycosyltransferase involved in cell wall biosynthesis